VENDMIIFLTGANGFIGSAVASTLVARGHRVRGLVRSDSAAEVVRATGAEPVAGSLAEVEVLAREAAGADGVVHTAGEMTADLPVVNATAVRAMLGGMDGGPFVTTSGAPVARSSRTRVSEDDVAGASGPLAWLAEAESLVLDASSARGIVVRPPMVYGDRRGPIAKLVAGARAEGVARYIGDGDNVWSTVHVRDLAVAYAVLLESRARGVFHAAEAAPTRMRDLFGAIGAVAAVPVASWSLEDAAAKHGPMAGFLAMDAALDATKLRGLGWVPRVGEALGGILQAVVHPTHGYGLAS
jgi:nucleoside-diphosphate-sugar epimerase